MRFLFDVHHFGMRETGNETWTRNMVSAFERRSGDVDVEYAVTSSGVSGLRKLTGAPLHEVSNRSARRLLFDIPRIARRINCDALLMTYTAPATPRPCVLAIHDLSYEDPASVAWVPLRTRASHRAAIRLSSKLASTVLVLSGHTRANAIDRLGIKPEKVVVASPAVDEAMVTLLNTSVRVHIGESFTVLVVGNVVPRKNLGVVGVAIEGCITAGIPMQLRVVGPIPHAGKEIANELRLRLGSAVKFVGYVSLEGLASEYLGADVLCYPSLFEGFGLPVIEAMAAGTPTIVSNATCLPEISGGASIVVDPYDGSAWKDALLALQGSIVERQRLIALGLDRCGDFSWDNTAAVALDALRIAGERRGTRRRRQVVSSINGLPPRRK